MTSSPPDDAIPPVRWGIVGASDIADRVMAPAMVQAGSASLVAIASRSPDRGRWFAQRHLRRAARVDTSAAPLRVYATAADLAADPGIDAVYVATEVDRHAADVADVAAAGRDALVEKPIARTAAEGQGIVDACAAAGVRLGTCFYQRYNARHRRLRELISDGAIGRVATVSFAFSGRSPVADVWRQDPARSGGGSFIDTASHCIDLARWLVGEVDQVMAFTASMDPGRNVEDTAFAILRFTTGVAGTIAAHWSTTDPSDERSSSVTVSGSDGTLTAWPLHDKFSRGSLVLATDAGEQAIEVPEASTHVALLEDFARARGGGPGTPFPITGDDGVAAARVVDAAYESARTGQAVRP